MTCSEVITERIKYSRVVIIKQVLRIKIVIVRVSKPKPGSMFSRPSFAGMLVRPKEHRYYGIDGQRPILFSLSSSSSISFKRVLPAIGLYIG